MYNFKEFQTVCPQCGENTLDNEDFDNNNGDEDLSRKVFCSDIRCEFSFVEVFTFEHWKLEE